MNKSFLVSICISLFLNTLFAQEKNISTISSKEYNRAQELNNIGYDSLLNEKYNDAIVLFQQAIDILPNDPTFYQNMAYCYSRLNSDEKAKENYLKALSRSPENPSLHNLCGQIEYKLKNDSLAIVHFSNAIKKVFPNEYNSTHSSYFSNRGNTYLRSQKYDYAIKDYTKSIHLNATFFGDYNNRAIAFFKKGNTEKACLDWKQVLLIDKKNEEVKKLFDKYCQDFISSTINDSIVPKNLNLPTYKGGYESLMKFLSENITYPIEARQLGIQGIVFLSFVVEKNGEISKIDVKRGIGFGCDKESVRVLKKTNGNWNPGTEDGKPTRTRLNIPIKYYLQQDFEAKAKSKFIEGNSFFKYNKLEEAIKAYTISIRINHKLKDAYFNRAVCYSRLKKHNAALKDFINAKKVGKLFINKDIADAYFNLGVSQYENQQYDSAIHYYSTAIKYNATNRDTYFNLAASYFNVEDIENACYNWQEAANLGMVEADKQQQLHCSNQKLSAYFYKKASILESNSNFEDAIEYYSMVIDLFPNVSGTYLKRANCYKLINQKNKACSDYKKAADLGNEGATKLKGDYCQ